MLRNLAHTSSIVGKIIKKINLASYCLEVSYSWNAYLTEGFLILSEAY